MVAGRSERPRRAARRGRWRDGGRDSLHDRGAPAWTAQSPPAGVPGVEEID